MPPRRRGRKKRAPPKTWTPQEPSWYERITDEESLTKEHIVRLFGINLKCQHKSRAKTIRNCINNPNCFVGLGERSEGVWADDPETLKNIGPDLSDKVRDISTPVGLENLGATCYMNSLLQCLFMNTTFRQGVYDWVPPPDENGLVLTKEEGTETPGNKSSHKKRSETSVCFQLQLLFAHLQHSIKKSYKPITLTKLLNLKTTIQQDAQEFNKLFVSYLEEKYEQSPNKSVQGLIKEQFCGEYAYVTTCMECGTTSASRTDFYELELAIKGMNTLDQCLRELLREEELDGANKYNCESCGGLQKATRSLKLCRLPRVLNLQLLRFGYDMKTFQRKKLHNVVRFPHEIDMTPYLDGREDASTSPPLYHEEEYFEEDDEESDDKGDDSWNVVKSRKSSRTPTKGKQTLDVNDEEYIRPLVGDHVYKLTAVLMHMGSSAMGGHYIAHICDSRSGQWWCFNDEDVTRLDQVNIGRSPDQIKKKKRKAGSDRPGEASSNHAYMAIYTMKEEKKEKRDEDEVYEPRVSMGILNRVEEGNEQFINLMEAREEARAQEMLRIEEHKKAYKELIQLLPAGEEDDSNARWISLHWLRHWITYGVPPPPSSSPPSSPSPSSSSPPSSSSSSPLPSTMIDNTSILCEHKGLRPEALTLIKRISGVGWATLCSQYSSNRELILPRDACITCCFQYTHTRAKEEELKRKKAETKYKLSRGRLQNGYWIDGEWLTGWLGNKSLDLGNDCNVAITCPHYGLRAGLVHPRIRVLPVELWSFIHSLYPESNEFPSSVKACSICEEEDERREEEYEARRVERAAIKKQFNDLFTRKRNRPTRMQEGKSYYVIPMEWWREWTSYLEDADVLEYPGTINTRVLLCEEHSGLLYLPLQDLEEEEHIIVLQHHWDKFNDIMEIEGPPVMFDMVRTHTHKEKGSNEQKQTGRGRGTGTGGGGRKEEEGTCVAISTPLPCYECRELRLKRVALERLEYTEGLVYVEYKQTSGRRSTRTRSNNRYALRNNTVTKKVVASSTDSIETLKLKIFAVVDIPPYKQHLLYGDTVLNESTSSLKDYEIPQKAVLQLEEVVPTDTGDGESNGKTESDAGFKGTILSGGRGGEEEDDEEEEESSEDDMNDTKDVWTCVACTLDNLHDHLICSTCGTTKPLKGQWACRDCTFLNNNASTECDVCSKRRG